MHVNQQLIPNPLGNLQDYLQRQVFGTPRRRPGQADLSTGVWTVPDGGTGQTTLTNHGVLVGAGTGAITQLGAATSLQVLLGQTGDDPSWHTLDGDATITGTGSLTLANFGTAGTYGQVTVDAKGRVQTSGTVAACDVTHGGTGASSLTANAVLLGNGSGAVAFATIGTAGRVLIDQGGSANPVFFALGGDIASVSSSGSVTLATVPVARGGTGVTSVTVSPTATAFAGWDANANLSAVSHINGYTTTATGGTTTTLTVGSTQQQYFTGSTTQTVKLPVASTLVPGQQFAVVNLSSGVVTVQSSGASTIQAQAANSIGIYTCILTSGTGSWSCEYTTLQPASGGTVTSVAGAGLVTGTVTTSGNLTVTAAIQSDMETGTSTTTAVVPGVMQYHPSSAKAWCKFNGSSASPITNDAAYNCDATTKNGTGDYTINWTTDFSSANYSATWDTGSGSKFVTSLAAGTFRVGNQNLAGSAVDTGIALATAFGDQ